MVLLLIHIKSSENGDLFATTQVSGLSVYQPTYQYIYLFIYVNQLSVVSQLIFMWHWHQIVFYVVLLNLQNSLDRCTSRQLAFCQDSSRFNVHELTVAEA